VGINEAELGRLWRRLQPLAVPNMPLDVPPPRTSRFGSSLVLSRVHWVQPELVAEVKYLTWMDENLLRQLVYEGLREDKPAAEVRRRPPHPKPAAAAPQPTPSKPQRSKRLPVPAENILQLLPDAVVPSREELCDYWEAVADDALAYLGRRPLKLVRNIKGTTFYHMGSLPEIPQAVNQLRLEKRKGGTGTRLWVEDLAGVLGLVEIGAVEIHPWGARVEDIEHPDTLVFDLDPGEGVDWGLSSRPRFGCESWSRRRGLIAGPK
jgi:bifunctional non-homologous end joining protein LigD